MSGLIGKKVGMTSVFDNAGKNTPVTVIEIEPCAITQIKTEETDGYTAVQLAAFDRKEKNVSKAVKGHFDKAGVSAKHQVVEFRDFIPEGLDVGDELNISDVFTVGDIVDVVAVSKGHGFTGVVKRHNFAGVGDATHGQHNRLRAPGAIGNASDPSRVFKGMRMAGRMGGDKVKVQNLKVLKVVSDKNLLVVKGCVPGHKNAYVIIQK